MTRDTEPNPLADGWPLPLAVTRRGLVHASAALASAPLAGSAAAQPQPGGNLPAAAAGPADAQQPAPLAVSLRVNGQARTLTVDPRTTVLDALREGLGLKGTKKGCDHGQCGACTVLIDGRRSNACPGPRRTSTPACGPLS